MANLPFNDVNNVTKYVKATGVGTDVDPYIPQRTGTTADGGDVTQGAIADAAATTDGGSFSLIALIKRLLGKFPATLGQKASTASIAVVVASDQSAVPVAGTFFQATQPISSASLPLPAGAATSANQTATNVSVASLDTKAPALGQALVGASVPVVLPATQIATLTPPAAITGFALEATLAAQSAKFPASIGAKTSAASLGVVLASDQATLNVNLAQRLDAANDSVNVGAVGGTLPDSTAIILASAARTATTASATITKPQMARGAIFLINTTAGVNATDTVQFTLEVQDPVGLSWRAIWTSAAVISFNGLSGYSVYPGGAAGSFSAFVAIPLPTNYRVRVVHATAASVTYSVSAVYCS